MKTYNKTTENSSKLSFLIHSLVSFLFTEKPEGPGNKLGTANLSSSSLRSSPWSLASLAHHLPFDERVSVADTCSGGFEKGFMWKKAAGRNRRGEEEASLNSSRLCHQRKGSFYTFPESNVIITGDPLGPGSTEQAIYRTENISSNLSFVHVPGFLNLMFIK